MKKFEVVSYKICPDCGYKLSPEIIYAYNQEWCPSCGCNYDEMFLSKHQNKCICGKCTGLKSPEDYYKEDE